MSTFELPLATVPASAPSSPPEHDAAWLRAARLARVDLVAPPRVIGKSTAESMRSGIVFGTVAMVDGVVARMKEELGPETFVLATGGLAALVCPLSVEIDENDPLLTLDGLRMVHELNARRPAETGDPR